MKQADGSWTHDTDDCNFCSREKMFLRHYILLEGIAKGKKYHDLTSNTLKQVNQIYLYKTIYDTWRAD